MTAYVIGAVVGLVAAGITLVAVSGLIAVVWRVGIRRLLSLPSSARAHALAALRILPAAAAIAAAAIMLLAFFRLEPANAGEVLGFTLPLMAGLTVLAFAARIRAACRASRNTARIVAGWHGERSLIDAEFPVVAVVGIWRPRLYVARRVIQSCDREELAAMIAHEEAHVAARDNLARFCFLAAPFAFAVTARAIETAWGRASEEAADDAARRDERASLALASALTKVARLATGQATPLLHVSAIFSGTSVAERVHRLLEQGPPPPASRWHWVYLVAIAVAGTATSAAVMMRPLYEAAEYCVRYLP